MWLLDIQSHLEKKQNKTIIIQLLDVNVWLTLQLYTDNSVHFRSPSAPASV